MIPKIVHFCWLSGEPYPEKIQRCINSWKEKLPDYEIMLWDKNRFDINKITWTKQAYEMKKYAFAADYIRFYALYNYGGIYLDSDVEVVKNFDDLLENEFFFGYEYTGCPEAAIVGAQSGLNWIKECMEWYENKEYNDYCLHNKCIIAPLVLQNGFERVNNIKLIDKGKIECVGNGTIFPYLYFSPKNTFSGEVYLSDLSYTIHHFNSAWLKDTNVNIDARYTAHVALIKMLGKKNYNSIMYRVRKILHKV